MELIHQLEKVLCARNPALVSLLKPGLPREKILELFRKSGIVGGIDPIIEIYTWKNGTRSDPKRTLEEMAMFPESCLCFEDFELMLDDCKTIGEIELVDSAPAIPNRRYFPLLWDSSSQWIAVDLKSKGSTIVLIDTDWPEPVREIYQTFNEFLRAAICANQLGVKLSCFGQS